MSKLYIQRPQMLLNCLTLNELNRYKSLSLYCSSFFPSFSFKFFIPLQSTTPPLSNHEWENMLGFLFCKLPFSFNLFSVFAYSSYSKDWLSSNHTISLNKINCTFWSLNRKLMSYFLFGMSQNIWYFENSNKIIIWMD